MPNKQTNQEDEFYQELDKKTEGKSCCSFYTLILLFAGLAFVIIFGAYRTFRVVHRSGISLPNFSAVENAFRDKIDSESNDPAKEIVLTTEELDYIFSNGLKSFSYNLNEPKASIQPAGITLTGRLEGIFNVKVATEISPEVRDQKVYLKITKFETARIPLPGILRAGLEKSLNQTLDSQLSSFYDHYEVTATLLEKDKMHIFGQLKK